MPSSSLDDKYKIVFKMGESLENTAFFKKVYSKDYYFIGNKLSSRFSDIFSSINYYVNFRNS